MAEDVTYFQKEDTVCPLCDSAFKREELRMGGGRLSAGELTEELRRLYIPTQKYGKVIPLIYPITVCPNCLYAADDYDFTAIPAKSKENVAKYSQIRMKYMMQIFERVPNFNEKRDLTSGLASYILAISCYPFFDKRKFAPTVKMGIYALRCAWLAADMAADIKDDSFLELSAMFYRKAAEYYSQAIQNQTKGLEPLDGARSLGPDTDKNFGYDGMVYLNGLLKFKTSDSIEDPIKKLKAYEEIKIILSKVFGFGKKAKEKPGPLLEVARTIYDKLAAETEALKESLGDVKLEE